MATGRAPRQGAFFDGDRLHFQYWAPERRSLAIELFDVRGQPVQRRVPLAKGDGGYFRGSFVPENGAALYKVKLDDDGPFPDPFSREQPFGVHGPSRISRVSPTETVPGWRGVRMEELVVAELHVGTATPEGTFDALAGKLDHYRSLGVSAIQLLPVASFPGTRNWGYDGVSLFAPASVYGGPEGLKRLIGRAHEKRLGVILDVVYNHLGPDGNYLGQYSRRYFTDRRHTPWGDALDTREPAVREMFLTNAEMWIREFGADGLRLDATHAILDETEPSILREIAERAREAGGGREVVVIAEDERNESRLVRPVAEGGLGLDGVWADDFHHQMRRTFAGDHEGYFEDFTDDARDLARTMNDGWLYRGQPSKHHGKPRGTSPDGVSPKRFVWCLQNHDQVGNRAFGERLSESVSAAAQRTMAALMLLSPATPMLFMGEEWAASTPFQYFTDHHGDLGRAVTEGRRREFAAFASFGHDIPDPQDLRTFERSRLDWSEPDRSPHREMLAWYRALLALRREHPALRSRERKSFDTEALDADTLRLTRRGDGQTLVALANLRGTRTLPLPPGAHILLSSADPRFGGAGEVSVDGADVHFSGPGVLIVTRNP